MIVEAKAPDVAPEVGYRDASLYARHLNQKFPKGINLCGHILSTNGRLFLYGSWAAEPDLQLSLSDLRVGAAGLEALRSRCSGRLLDQISARFANSGKDSPILCRRLLRLSENFRGISLSRSAWRICSCVFSSALNLRRSSSALPIRNTMARVGVGPDGASKSGLFVRSAIT